MNRGGTGTETRRSTLRLGQIMAGICVAGAVFGLTATVKALKGGSTEVQFVLAWIGCYGLYLGFLLMLASSYFTRTQRLILISSAGILSVLLIQTVATSSGEWALLAMLTLPVVPFILGLLMLRYQRAHYEPQEETPEESETLTTLVRNKRSRGLTPQADQDSGVLDGAGLREQRRTILTWCGIVLLIVSALVALSGRTYHLRRAEYHSQQENRWSEKALALRDTLREVEAKLESDSSPSLKKEAEDLQGQVDECMRKAEWHAKRSEQYANRWP